MKPITKKPLKAASARKPLGKALPPRKAAPIAATPVTGKIAPGMTISAPGHPLDGGKIVSVATGAAQKAAKAPKVKPAAVAPAPEPVAAPAAVPAPRATLRSLAQAVVTDYDDGEDVKQAISALRDFLAAAPKAERGPAKPTDTQAALIAACQRPSGATAKELADAAGWPSIAARSTMTKIADRFGYALSEKAKADGRGITFYLSHRPEA